MSPPCPPAPLAGRSRGSARRTDRSGAPNRASDLAPSAAVAANQAIEGRGQVDRLEVFARIEVVVSRLVDHPQLPMALGISVAKLRATYASRGG
jgi:hypothetical protein